MKQVYNGGEETKQKPPTYTQENYKMKFIKLIKSNDSNILGHQLIDAVKNNDLQNVKKLIEEGANVNVTDYKPGKSALLYASEYNNLEIVRELIKAGADVNEKTLLSVTPLMKACDNGNLEMVEELVKNGADVNAKDNFRKSVLTYVKGKNSYEIVQFLKSNGAIR